MAHQLKIVQPKELGWKVLKVASDSGSQAGHKKEVRIFPGRRLRKGFYTTICRERNTRCIKIVIRFHKTISIYLLVLVKQTVSQNKSKFLQCYWCLSTKSSVLWSILNWYSIGGCENGAMAWKSGSSGKCTGSPNILVRNLLDGGIYYTQDLCMSPSSNSEQNVLVSFFMKLISNINLNIDYCTWYGKSTNISVATST